MRRQAFGLLELIGILAILAILSAFVLPRMMRVASPQMTIQVSSEARITEAVIALQSLQSAAATHVAQHGCLACMNGVPLTFSENYDGFAQVLLAEGVTEKPFYLTLATNSVLRLRRISSLSAGSAVDGINGAYSLDSSGKNTVIGAIVLEAVLPGVAGPDARALNERIDGAGPPVGAGGADKLGRVIHPPPDAQGRTDVHVYLLHM
jgi:type II secretory pathway pseudopilin PulG